MSAVFELTPPADVRRNGATTSQPERLGSTERLAAGAVVAMLAGLGVIGAVVSFASVVTAVEPSFGRLAWTVPVGVDLGIAVFTALDLLLVRVGMRMRFLRVVPWALVGVTIYLNVAGEDHLVGAVAHGVLPLLWVLAIEVGAHVLRSWAGLHGNEDDAAAERRARGRMDRVRLSRWLLAPASTAALWRRMKLWEERSYPRALTRERDRVLARCDLQDEFGRIAWRWHAPRRQRALYRLGELAPASALPAPAATDGPPMTAVTGAVAPARGGPSRRRGAAPPTSRRRTTAERKPTATSDELLAVAREVAHELAAQDLPVTRDRLAQGIRARGHSVSNAGASELMGQLGRRGSQEES